MTYTYNGTAYTNYLGNYWDDYEGTDADADGIGNTPYSIDSEEDESDEYPLMIPFENQTSSNAFSIFSISVSKKTFQSGLRVLDIK